MIAQNQGSLTDAQVSDYWESGFINNVEVLSAKEAASWLSRLEVVESAQREQLGGTWDDRDYYPWRDENHPMIPWYAELARHPALLDAVASVLGPDLLIRNADIFIKEPGVRRQGIGWHWDTAQRLDDVDQFLSVWLGLTPSTDTNGGRRFIRGGHRIEIPDAPKDKFTLTFNATARAALTEHEKVNNDMPAGSMSLHHAHMPHSSMPNRSDSRRAAFVIRFMSTSISQEMAESGVATLVRGTDNHGHFKLNETFPVTWNAAIP